MQCLQSAVYSSTFGDAMLLGLSNVLCLPIAVFTSIESRSYNPIHLQSPSVDINPILLTFLHVGPGHFSLAVIIRKETGDNQKTRNSNKRPTVILAVVEGEIQVRRNA